VIVTKRLFNIIEWLYSSVNVSQFVQQTSAFRIASLYLQFALFKIV